MKLNRYAGYADFPGPVVTVVMDGMGIGPENESNGIYMAYTPQLDALKKEPLYTELKAHGTAVGMPSDDDMGNSEVGHNALGAGRIFSQGAMLVNEAIRSGFIFQGKAWKEILNRTSKGGTLHLLGMVSDGNVHSHIDHLYALLDRAAAENIRRVRVHGLLDGRDVGEKSGLSYFEPLEQKLADLSREGRDYRIASGGGRMVTTMDRYQADWSVVERGWQAHVLGEGRAFASATEAIRTYYAEDPDITDQYMESFVVQENGKPVGTIEDGDAVVLFNFRGDRAIEISRAFDENDFAEFDRKRVPHVFYAGMMQYDGDAGIPKNYLVEPPAIDRTLGEYLCASGITSFAISETQKFGHVTYFWNGNNSGYIDEKLEKYVEILSDRIAFDLRPWMKAAEITDQVIEAIHSGRYKFIRLNYANGDMVGHTGIPSAIRIAVATVDMCLGRLLKAVRQEQGVMVITADHGNADCMWTEKKGVRSPMVAHTINPVPFIIKDFSGKNGFSLAGVEKAGLSNIAATLCNLLGFEAPADYDPSLITLKQG
ncbi:MAG: 2,3-bisphosphoglycerate-independent phosphoglycerate mutase [Proteobacteria bacterium]|nr:2,3-bisphosphoglycerate-independent phosphoglycerate mutase [Pseudomonadota bacterium]MBU0964848.1 2,3-bisphosphoglycerate-independent phosphoglycerate mutase [Pseudomonadota bacterium]